MGYRRGSTSYHDLARRQPEDSVHRTYKLSRDLAERVKATATTHRVGHSDLVRFLLSKALDQLDEGQLRIRTKTPDLLIIDTD